MNNQKQPTSVEVNADIERLEARLSKTRADLRLISAASGADYKALLDGPQDAEERERLVRVLERDEQALQVGIEAAGKELLAAVERERVTSVMTVREGFEHVLMTERVQAGIVLEQAAQQLAAALQVAHKAGIVAQQHLGIVPRNTLTDGGWMIGEDYSLLGQYEQVWALVDRRLFTLTAGKHVLKDQAQVGAGPLDEVLAAHSIQLLATFDRFHRLPSAAAAAREAAEVQTRIQASIQAEADAEDAKMAAARAAWKAAKEETA